MQVRPDASQTRRRTTERKGLCMYPLFERRERQRSRKTAWNETRKTQRLGKKAGEGQETKSRTNKSVLLYLFYQKFPSDLPCRIPVFNRGRFKLSMRILVFRRTLSRFALICIRISILFHVGFLCRICADYRVQLASQEPHIPLRELGYWALFLGRGRISALRWCTLATAAIFCP